MQQFMWAEMYPDLMDGTVGMSCQPVEISGRNYMLRRGAAEAIRHDPDWNNGNYDKNPTHYEYAAAGNDLTESPVRIQEEAPTMEAAKALYDKRLARSRRATPTTRYGRSSRSTTTAPKATCRRSRRMCC
jgi:homoserine O-acetyltransferase